MRGRSLPRAMRRICSANSVNVRTTRSGAPRTVPEAIEPANIPTSKPRAAAMRADIGSKTDAGWTQTLPSSTRRYCLRRSESSIMVTTFRWGSCQGKRLGVRRRSDLERVEDAADDAVVADERGELDEPGHAMRDSEPVEQRLRHDVTHRELTHVVDHVSLAGRKAREIPAIADGGDGRVADSCLPGRRRMGRPHVGAILLAGSGDDGQLPRLRLHLRVEAQIAAH